jgi:hypothetical protein
VSTSLSQLISSPDLSPVVSLAGWTRQAWTELAGYRKSFRIPDRHAGLRRQFLAELATEDIEQDLQATFQKLKSVFEFRRRQMQVSEPVDGSGSIKTPDFEYRISLLEGDDTRHVLWERTVCGFRNPQIMESQAFRAVFGECLTALQIEVDVPLDIRAVIDEIEDTADAATGSCCIDYDPAAHWCELRFQGFAAVMRLEADLIRVSTSRQSGPAGLLHAYGQLQQRFRDTLGL